MDDLLTIIENVCRFIWGNHQFVLSLVVAVLGILWFVLRARHRVRLNLSQSVCVLRLPDGPEGVLLKVQVKLQNIGEVPFNLRRFEIFAHTILPLPSEVEEILYCEHVRERDSGKSRWSHAAIDELLRKERDDGTRASLWPTPASAHSCTDKYWKMEIRPGETDNIDATLFISTTPSVEMVNVVSQVERNKGLLYRRGPLSWRARSLVTIAKEN